MADAAPTTPVPPPDLSTMAAGPDADRLSKDLGAMARQHMAREDRAIAGMERQLSRDERRLDAAFQAEGVGPDAMKPWQPEKEHRKYESDPVQGFASAGFVFAQIAAAFTRVPMEAALNGGAAALNAIQQGNEEAYQRAYKAWKENTDLAVKRQELMHQHYQDAATLMQHNLEAGRARLQMEAARFGDAKMTFLLENGMDKEVFEAMDARQRLATSMSENMVKVQEDHEKMSRLFAMRDTSGQPLYDPKNPGSPRSQQALMEWGKENRRIEREQKAPYLRGTVADQERMQLYNQKIEEFIQREGRDPSAEEKQKMFNDTFPPKGAAGGVMTFGRFEAQEIARRREEKIKEGKDPAAAYNEAVHEVKEAGGVMTPNRRDEIQGKLDMAERIVVGSEKNLDFLQNFKGGAGLMGKIMRGAELAGNIGGTTETERKDFYRQVKELQEMVPKIITDSNGRPLKAAQDAVSAVVAGLEAGDTSPNTISAYRALIEEMRVRQQYYHERLGEPGVGARRVTPSVAPPAEKAAGDDWYRSAPLVGGRGSAAEAR